MRTDAMLFSLYELKKRAGEVRTFLMRVNEIIFTLYLENDCSFESKERLGKMRLMHHGVD
jgi:hypothetical protein